MRDADREQIIGEVKKALLSADRAQRCHADDRPGDSLYYINGVQDRLRELLVTLRKADAPADDEVTR